MTLDGRIAIWPELELRLARAAADFDADAAIELAAPLALAGLVALLVERTLTARRGEAAARDAERRLRAELEERRRIEQELREQGLELARSNRELEEFAYVVSHDLREPLRGLHNFSRFLIEDHADRLDADGRRMLETLGRLTQRLELLIGAILQYSRVGRFEISREPCDLGRLVDDVRAALAPYLDEHRADVAVERPLPTVSCDPVRAAQVFQYLITNAVQFNDRDEKEVLLSWEDGPVATLIVADDGIGVDPRHREAVFRIFKRLHPRDAYGGGAGAGLTITRRIVERHGGSIEIRGREPRGTIVRFDFGAPAEAKGPQGESP